MECLYESMTISIVSFLLIFLTGCDTGKSMKMTITKEVFGKTVDGTAVYLYTLTNTNGCEAKITNYGGIVVSLKVPDRTGKLIDVVLGYDTLEEYIENNPYFGSIVGRYGNRIGKGKLIAYVPNPDGMAVDAKGRLYITGSEGVVVLRPNGKWIGVIAVDERPANCTFGGPEFSTLYITARTSLYAVKTRTRGWHVHLDGKPASKK